MCRVALKLQWSWPYFQFFKTNLIIWNNSVTHIWLTIVSHKDCHFKIHNKNIDVHDVQSQSGHRLYAQVITQGRWC